MDRSADIREVRIAPFGLEGGADTRVVALNRTAFERLRCEKELVVVPGAGHLFEEPGALDQVIGHAARWLARFLAPRSSAAGQAGAAAGPKGRKPAG